MNFWHTGNRIIIADVFALPHLYQILDGAEYLSNVSLHHTDWIDQDVSGKPLDLLSKSSAEQKGCEGNDSF